MTASRSGVANVDDPRDVLLPYVPRLVRRWMLDHPERRATQMDSTVVFVDISGFTQLSERLARRGKIGAEELSTTIGSCFTRLLAVAYANDGSLLKFGGDALLLLFSGTDHVVRGCRAAVGMRQTLREVGRIETQGGKVNLRMSVGVHTGTFNFFLVGTSHRELVIAGPAATQTVSMEATATAGEILVSGATAAQLPPSVVGDVKGPGRLLRAPPPPGLSPPSAADDVSVAAARLLQCIPVAIRQRLIADLHEPEHRRVTVAFLSFTGTDALIEQRGPDAAADCLDAVVTTAQQSVDRHGVSFLGTDIAHDGGKIILATGAPLTRGNDEERMLLTVREILDAVPPVSSQAGITLQVGINRGHVFAGDVGPPYRRTYTVMGDAVNLAARLMASASPGDILATRSALHPSRTTFAAVALPPFQVKGKRQPVQAFRVGAVTRSHDLDAKERLPLIGRDTEMADLVAALAAVQEGSGRLLQVIGEAGMGKSRLVEELRRHAGRTRALSLPCALYESSSPYAAFRGVTRDLLGIPEQAEEAQARQRLTDVLAQRAPDLLAWAPLLGLLVDVELSPTQETARIEQQFRRTHLHRVAIQLFRALVDGPTLWTVEDAHWMDEASADLLTAIVDGLSDVPWLICVTRRQGKDGFVAQDRPQVTTLQLAPLEGAEAVRLAEAVTESLPLPAHQMEVLVARSGGNPLFLRELVAGAQAAGGVEDLPESVEALITARIDRLTHEERTVLRYLSVLGQTFSRALAQAVLVTVHTDAAEPAQRDEPVNGEVSLRHLGDFLEEDHDTVRFRHALIRDAAYESLSYRVRRRLHAEIGEIIERGAGEDPDSQAELLSFHFLNAQRDAEAWRYSLVAAERARSIYANADADEFYQRALKASMRMLDTLPLEVARVHESLGEVREHRGAYTEAAAAYRAARRFVSGNPVDQARLLLKSARTQGWLGRFSPALRSIRRGLNMLHGIDSPEASRQRAQLMVWYARFSQESGRPAAAIDWSMRAIEESTQVGERTAMADAYKVLDWAYMDLGQVDKVVYSQKALAIYEELDDLAGQAAILNNMGAMAYWQGRWTESIALYERAGQLEKRTGSEVGTALVKSNMAEILSDQGHWEEAETLFREVLRVWQAAGHRVGMADARRNLGRTASRLQRHDEALRLLTEVLAEFSDVGARVDVLETQARIAESHVLRGDGAEALRSVDAALARAHSLGDVAAQRPLLLRVRGYALLQLGTLDDAAVAFAEALDAARQREADYEVALTLRGVADLAAARDLPADEETAQADAVFHRLEVLRVPVIPFPVSATR